MKMKIKQTLLVDFFCMSRNALYEWKKQNRPVILFLQKYFSDEDISQFLNKGKINYLEYLEDSKDVTNSIIKEVFNNCQKLKKLPEIKEFGKFLEKIESKRAEKTWMSFKEYSEKEEEIWNWLNEEFHQYLIKNNCPNKMKHIVTIGRIQNGNINSDYYIKEEDFIYFSLAHRYYFIKNFMWMFMPSVQDNNLSQIKKIYTSLPLYLQKIPDIKLIIKAMGKKFTLKDTEQ
jgi:hypothetical protein